MRFSLQTVCARRKKNILVSAYACLPDAGSEPGMGWNWVIRLAEYFDVWILTEEVESARVLRGHLARLTPALRRSLNIVGIERERVAGTVVGQGDSFRKIFYYNSYRRWQRQAYAVARSLHAELNFSLAHQLNMIGFREPGYLWLLGIPFVWGPVGGLTSFPWRYMGQLRLREFFYVTAKNLVNSVQIRTASRVKKALQRANVVFAANSDNAVVLRKHFGRNAVVLNETGTVVRAEEMKPVSSGRPPALEVVWCGAVVSRKVLGLALEVIRRVSTKIPVRFHVVGTGPNLSGYKRMAESQGLSGICRWYGKVPREEVVRILRSSHVLLFPSLVEGTPHVVLESLTVGTPVVCHACCGQGDVVTEECGVLVEVRNPKYSIARFCDALLRLGKDQELLARLSHGAYRRASELTWDAVVEKAVSHYPIQV